MDAGAGHLRVEQDNEPGAPTASKGVRRPRQPVRTEPVAGWVIEILRLFPGLEIGPLVNGCAYYSAHR